MQAGPPNIGGPSAQVPGSAAAAREETEEEAHAAAPDVHAEVTGPNQVADCVDLVLFVFNVGPTPADCLAIGCTVCRHQPTCATHCLFVGGGPRGG